MTVIFLDIDGVLNSTYWLLNQPIDYVCPDDMWDMKAVDLLNDLVADTNAKIVISSTWRIPFIQNPDGLAPYFHNKGIKGDIIGLTDDEPDIRRNQIKRFLDLNSDITKFVILDDSDDMGELMPFLVKTNLYYGLTKDDIIKAKKILGDLNAY